MLEEQEVASGDRDRKEDRECGPQGTSPVYPLVQGPSGSWGAEPEWQSGKRWICFSLYVKASMGLGFFLAVSPITPLRGVPADAGSHL